MPVSQNSIVSYSASVLNGHTASQSERILALLRSAHRPMSRREIASYFKFPAQDGGDEVELSSVCGRVTGMLPDPDKGWPGLIRVHHVERNGRGHPVDFLEAVPAGEVVQSRMVLDFVGQHQEAMIP